MAATLGKFLVLTAGLELINVPQLIHKQNFLLNFRGILLYFFTVVSHKSALLNGQPLQHPHHNSEESPQPPPPPEIHFNAVLCKNFYFCTLLKTFFADTHR